MPHRARLGTFLFQVRLVLLLLVLFLAALNLVNLVLLTQAREAMLAAERERAAALASRAVLEIGGDSLLRAAGTRDPGSLENADAALRRSALRAGFRGLALLDSVGRSLAGTGSAADPRATELADLPEDGRAALKAGRPVSGSMEPSRGGEQAEVRVLVPLLDPSARLVGIVRAVVAVPELGRLERSFRVVVGVQVAGVLVILALAVLFANWVSRPYRRLAAAAGEAGLTRPGARAETDPDDLASAFRAVVGKLREQEEALGALGRESGGLGDLVRFATRAAGGMSTGVLVLDRQARVAAINAAARAHLACGNGELRDVPLQQVGGGVEGLGALVGQCLDQGKGATREVLPFRAADGRTRHLGVAISPAPGRGSEVAGALVLTTDLTEIRRLQEQARIRESLAAVGQLSAGIAHEFRNALGTILGYARMLEKRDDPRVRGPAGEIVREVDSVRAAVDEFLLYARPPEPSRSAIDVGGLARSCAAGAPEGTAVAVVGEFGTVVGDEGQLRRAFGNLIQNAAEAGKDAGRPVSVRIVGRRAGGGRLLQVEVDDDGPGIPPDRRAQVFVPFFTTRSHGTGLGLALVQRTVVDMGGSVEVTEGPRGGALFRIRLPLAAGEVAAAGRPAGA